MGDLGQPQLRQHHGHCGTCVLSCVRVQKCGCESVYLLVNVAVGSRYTDSVQAQKAKGQRPMFIMGRSRLAALASAWRCHRKGQLHPRASQQQRRGSKKATQHWCLPIIPFCLFFLALLSPGFFFLDFAFWRFCSSRLSQ